MAKALTALAMQMALATPAFAEQPHLTANSGQIEYHSSNGKTTIIANGVDYCSPTLSPDGKAVAYIRALKPQDSDREGIAELWIADGPTGKSRRLIGPHPMPDLKTNFRWFDGPIFSANGKAIYVNADAWGDEWAVHRVDIASGNQRFVIDGDIVSVVKTGPYRGDLVVARHTSWPLPKIGFHYPLYIVRPNGKVLFRVPMMDADDDRAHLIDWLAVHHWEAW